MNSYEKPFEKSELLQEILKAVNISIERADAQIEPILIHIWQSASMGKYILEICVADDESVFVDL